MTNSTFFDTLFFLIQSFIVDAPDLVSSDDGIAATVNAAETAYAESLAAINEGRAMLASLGASGVGSSSAGDTIMGGETAHKKRGAVDDLNDVDPDL